MCRNLKKARMCWIRMSRVLRADNASPWVNGMLYKATVQAIVLYRSKLWCLTPATLPSLKGFHVKVARRMTGILPKMVSGAWKYPRTEDVPKAAGLHTIAHYIQVLHNSTVKWLVDLPIFRIYGEAERRCGSPPRLYWWEQHMDLGEASGGTTLNCSRGRN